MVPPQAPSLLSTTATATSARDSALRAAVPARRSTRASYKSKSKSTAATVTTADAARRPSAAPTATALPASYRDRNLRRQGRTFVSSTPSHTNCVAVVVNHHNNNPTTTSSSSSSPQPAVPRRRVSRVRSNTPSYTPCGQRLNVVSQAPAAIPPLLPLSPTLSTPLPPPPQPPQLQQPSSLRPDIVPATFATDIPVRRNNRGWSLRPGTEVGPACPPRKKAKFDSRSGAAGQGGSSSYAGGGEKTAGDSLAAATAAASTLTLNVAEISPGSRRRSSKTTTRLDDGASVDLGKGKPQGRSLKFPSESFEADSVGAALISSSPAPDTAKHGTPQGKEAPASSGSAEKRSLRSHGGVSANKSELAAYFPDYEEIVQLQPAKKEFLGVDTEISVIDDLSRPLDLTEHAIPKQPEFLNPLLNPVEAEIVKLPQCQSSNQDMQDPLSDDLYFKAHRRLERQEKQLRNIERDRAQHEKIQLDRLLEELEGHDWLRTMGISGITDTEKKLYEPKRVYFVQEVSALINKFKVWKEEEKRRRLVREQALLDAECDEDESVSIHSNHPDDVRESEEAEERGDEDNNFTRESDVDAMAAHQLHQETLSASSTPHNLKRPKLSIRALEAKTRRPPLPPSMSTKANAPPQLTNGPELTDNRNSPGNDAYRPQALPLQDQQQQQQQQQQPSSSQPGMPVPQALPPAELKPFTSFYTHPHIRDIALGKTKASRRSRSRLAFGQPVPELPEQEFELPSNILTEEAIHAAQRKLRRLRRQK
ncbi:hypothetical protein AAP_03132 [Ascosphaera apis ARSEF 7405]|uniref:Something about silencing protein 4 domain-containing protein n=1 Tax=Ascosphaera apis ARSEF 7405 TaxID=392613 RepID=A0A162IDM7_9EURO|nr:hypothetical protein AAP_03132 [Ascosphaera apis ARSEF 7405]